MEGAQFKDHIVILLYRVVYNYTHYTVYKSNQTVMYTVTNVFSVHIKSNNYVEYNYVHGTIAHTLHMEQLCTWYN